MATEAEKEETEEAVTAVVGPRNAGSRRPRRKMRR